MTVPMHAEVAATGNVNGQPPTLDVTVLLPCRNEGHTVAVCTTRAMAWLGRRRLNGEVLVVDNGSTDNSGRSAQAAGARVITESRIGYGHALRTGIHAAQGRVVIMADADDTYDLTNLDAFYDPIAFDRTHDVVVGNRLTPRPSRAAMTRSHYAGNLALSVLTRAATGTPVHDIHCGLRSFTRAAMTDLPTWSTGMELATHMLTHAHLRNLRITQTPITLHPPAAGRKSHLHPIRDGLRHLRTIVREARRRHQSRREAARPVAQETPPVEPLDATLTARSRQYELDRRAK